MKISSWMPRWRARRVAALTLSWLVWSFVALAGGVSGWHWTAAQVLEAHSALTVAMVVFNLSLTLGVIVGVWGSLLDISISGIRDEPAPAAVARFPGALLTGFGAGLVLGAAAHPAVTAQRPGIGVTALAMMALGMVLLAFPWWLAGRRRAR